MLKYDAAAQGNKAKKKHFEGTYLQGYFNRKGSVAKILGYGPRKGFKATSRKTSDSNELIYDVTYTINNNGLRVTPSHNPNAQCALFFGCSVTFGEGVEDDEAYPYQVGLQSEGRIQTYNFGFHGYGPHQMLAALESGFVDSNISCKPTYVVYLGISSHINRLLGLSAWDPNGPWYVLDEAGSAKRIGRFSDPDYIKPPKPLLEPEWRKYLSTHWHTFRQVAGPWLPFNEQSIQLYLAVIRKSRDLAAHNYPGVNFHIVLWDVGRHKKFAQVIENKLEDEDIRVHRISEIIPDYDTRMEDYKIRLDGHPTPIVYKKIALYLTEEFLSVRE